MLLKHPGGVPAGAGVNGWFAGLFGEPGKWHAAQTGAFDGSVSVCVRAGAGPRQGGSGCGWTSPWQPKQETSPLIGLVKTTEKSFPWQIWQEKKLELPGAFFAAAPCTAGSPQFVTAGL